MPLSPKLFKLILQSLDYDKSNFSKYPFWKGQRTQRNKAKSNSEDLPRVADECLPQWLSILTMMYERRQ